MKLLAVYNWPGSNPFTVEYDPDAPCRLCGLPVVAASMGGTSVCASCDCGRYRDGTRIDCMPGSETHKQRARRIHDLIIHENEADSKSSTQLSLSVRVGSGMV